MTEIKKAIEAIGKKYDETRNEENSAPTDERRIFCAGMVAAYRDAMETLDAIKAGEK